jgi:hypothetical protein
LFFFTVKVKEQEQVFEPTFRLVLTVSWNTALSRMLLASAALALVMAARSWSRKKKWMQRQSAGEGGLASPDSWCPGGQMGEVPGMQDPSIEHTRWKPEGQEGRPAVVGVDGVVVLGGFFDGFLGGFFEGFFAGFFLGCMPEFADPGPPGRSELLWKLLKKLREI